MKINKIELNNFIKSIIVGGSLENKEALFDFEKNILKISCLRNDDGFAVRGEMKINEIPKNSVGIDSLKDFISIIGSFKDEEIDLTINANKIVLEEPLLSVEYCLKNPEYIINKLEEPKFEKKIKESSGNTIKLPSNIIKEIIGYGNLLKTEIVFIEGMDNNIFIRTTDSKQNKLIKGFKLEENIKTPFAVKLSVNFLEILKTLGNNENTISCFTDKPILISSAGKTYSIIYLLQQLKK